ncbi:MAG: hypothetical protein MK095_02005 [Phycisphaerales bacterium]|nr:hypothetical protein [Phycisphaerales bacterium]
MRLTLSRSRSRPIALDLGSSSIKMLQLDAQGQRITTAVESTAPPEAAASPDQYLEWIEHSMPELLRNSSCTGKNVVVALPSLWTNVQHVQLDPKEAPNASEIAPMMLPPLDEEVLTQVIEIGPVECEGHGRIEFIIFAAPRRLLFKAMDIFNRMRCNVLDLRTQFGAAIAAFDHVHQDPSADRPATLYVDLGTSGIRAAVTNGTRLVQARSISMGTEHDARNMSNLLQADPRALAGVIDELQMMLRHDAAVFPDRSIERMIFLGRGAHADETCRRIVEAVRLPGQRGDPLSPFVRPDDTTSPVCLQRGPRPEWASVAGLAAIRLHAQEHHHAA